MASPAASIYVDEHLLNEKLERELLPSHQVDGCVIPDTIADDVLNSLKSHHDLDELFDVESLLPHMEERLIVTATDKYQIQQLPTQKAKVIALINAVKNKGQKRTKLIQLYASVYDSHEREHGHGKHYDTLGILSQAAWNALKIPVCQQQEYLDTEKVIGKVLHTCGSHMKLDKILKNFHEKSPCGGIGDLIHALLQQVGLGHLVSGLFPICKSTFQVILMYILLLICLYTL